VILSLIYIEEKNLPQQKQARRLSRVGQQIQHVVAPIKSTVCAK